MSAICSIRARMVLDSRGYPTVEVDVTTNAGAHGRAIVPSGASTGRFEARELRDGGARWSGRGVDQAVANVNGEIAHAVTGFEVTNLESIDRALERRDGTSGLERLGSNAVLGVSLAAAHAAAAEAGVPLWRQLAIDAEVTLPVPFFNLLNGGRHADNGVPIQEMMLVPAGAPSFSEAVRMGSETRTALAALLRSQGLSTGVGDEGGFAPELESPDQALELLLSAVEAAGYQPGRDAWLAIDVAANELQDSGGYVLYADELASSEEAIALWVDLCRKYPVIAIEDPLGEDDFQAWQRLRTRLPDGVQLVGDDLLVTHEERIAEAGRLQLVTAVIIKPNQAGTITRTLDAARRAREHGLLTIASHRSGDSEDTTIAHVAVAIGAVGIKAGAPCRSERVAKYNELLRIEESLGSAARYAGPHLIELSSASA